MVPGNKVVDCERNATSVGTSKIISDVLEDCISLPFSVLSILRAFGFLMIYRGEQGNIDCEPNLRGNDGRPKRTKGIEALSKTPLTTSTQTLPFSSRDIISSCVSCNLDLVSAAKEDESTYWRASSLVTFLQVFPITITNSAS